MYVYNPLRCMPTQCFNTAILTYISARTRTISFPDALKPPTMPQYTHFHVCQLRPFVC